LFGHVKGSFTGADKEHRGLFEQADGGTLFLDEVGELTAQTQVKLLRALQQGEITKVGSEQTINVDVRIIAATHRDLMQQVESGSFREDLFYRLAVGIVDIPALRERIEDIPELVNELTDEINLTTSKLPGAKGKNISDNAIKFILSQPWPGNIRELWNTLNRALLWSENKLITEKDLSDAIVNRRNINDCKEVVLSYNDQVDIIQLTEQYQKKYVEAALKASGNMKKSATKILGLKDHQTLSNWMKRLGIASEK
jgi:transcriptional regulator with GAF, ATPase, and Fis domain